MKGSVWKGMGAPVGSYFATKALFYGFCGRSASVQRLDQNGEVPARGSAVSSGGP